jgi:septal ring factor EnvC (AmiA/AmiB activator)
MIQQKGWWVVLLGVAGILGAGVVDIRLSMVQDDDLEHGNAKVVKQLKEDRATLRREMSELTDALGDIAKGLADYGRRIERLEHARDTVERRAMLRDMIAEQLREAAEQGRKHSWDRAMDGFEAERKAWLDRQRRRRSTAPADP